MQLSEGCWRVTMQTTFDGSLGAGAAAAGRIRHDDTLVVMRSEDSGLELLGEDLTLRLSPDDVRTLLFYGSTVEIEVPGSAVAAISVEPRRYAIVLAFRGCAYRAPRWAITAVARGRLPVAYLQSGRRRSRAVPPAPSRPQRMADVRG